MREPPPPAMTRSTPSGSVRTAHSSPGRARQISGAGFTDTETTDVVYNPGTNEWLVAWKSRQPGVSANQELFGQRLGADGTQVGTNVQKLTDFRGASGNANDAMAVAV